MADRASEGPQIKILRPAGVNLRTGRNAIPQNQADRCQGLYPKQTGLLSRFLGRTLMRNVGDEVLQLCQTFDGSGNILMQVGNTLQAFTLDQLKNISSTFDLDASVGNEEDQVGMAVITQTEGNTTPGGSIDGFLSGVSAATADTFYGARLTNMWVNETVNTLLTVNTFTASTGGSGAASTAGTFTLVPGTYRIYIQKKFLVDLTGRKIVFGLYNATSAAFETYTGTSEPILGTVVNEAADTGATYGVINAAITVSSSNKTFQIMQKCSNATLAQSLTCCGPSTGSTNTNVNGAAAKNVYTIVKIWRMT